MKNGVIGAMVVGATLFVAPGLNGVAPLEAALLSVSVGIVLTALLVGSMNPLALTFGAGAALFYVFFAPIHVALAGAFGLALAYGPRAGRARSRAGGVLTLLGAVSVGALAFTLADGYSAAAFASHASAIVIGALAVTAPLLIPVDDSTAHALLRLSRATAGVSRTRLLRAVAVRRQYCEIRSSLIRATRRRMDKAFAELIRTAQSASSASAGTRPMLEQRMATYVRALSRATRAATRARDLSSDLDDAVLRELRNELDELVARAEALSEVGAEDL